MVKKVIIETGSQDRYDAILDEEKDARTGKHYMNQKSFPTSEEADKFLDELGSDKCKLGILMGTEQKEQPVTKVLFTEYVEDWFYGEHAHVIKHETLKVRQVLLNKHIVPYFGDKYLHDITEQEVAELIAQKTREGYSKSTISSVHNFLSTLFNSAVKKGYLHRNPVRFMNMVKVPNRMPVILSESEVEKLLEVAHSEGEGMMYEFEISTGLRLAELLALSWSDIDFEHQMININKYVDDDLGDKQKIVEMRSDFRSVIIPSNLLPKLQRHKEEQQLMKEELDDQYNNEHDLVFPKKDGGIQRPSTVRARFKRLVEKANISKINFHDLRKTHASLLVKAGVPLYLVSKQLGYKSVNTLYHLLPPQFSASMKSIKLFGVNDRENDIE